MVFNLQTGDGVPRMRENVVEELGGEVADSDRLAHALVDKLFERLPCLHYGDFVRLHNLVFGIHPPSLW